MGSTVEEEVVERPALAMRGGSFPVAVAHLASADLDAIACALAAKVEQAAALFRNAPVVIDLQEVGDASLEMAALVDVLRQHGLIPIAVRHGNEAQHAAAQRAGLGVLHGGRTMAAEAPAAPAPTAVPAALPRPGRIVTQPVRSGQRVVATDGDLVILAPVNTGAEVLAAGNVHVYAPLRGRALAGFLGDPTARIFTLSLEAELVAIAGVYRAIEDDLPEDVHHQPAQVLLDGDRLIIAPLSRGDKAKRTRK